MSKGTTTLKEAVEKYVAHLKELGKNERTIETYGRHLDLAIGHFGEKKDIAKILPVHVSTFFKSDAVNKLIREPKKDGDPPRERPRSPHTVAQTKRVLRQMLVFCKEQNWVEKVAIPKSEMPRVKEAADPDQPAEAATEGK